MSVRPCNMVVKRGRRMAQDIISDDPRSAILAAAFRHALMIAAEMEGATAPNPPVGCVALDEHGKILVAAGHPKAGQSHTEALAIRLAHEAGVADRIATLIVTLEPCNHHGRTGPCTEAILNTAARGVWHALPDTNPVASGGAERLRLAGLSVRRLAELAHPDRADLLADATRLPAPFTTRVQRGRPFLTVMQAMDKSGSMIPLPGQKTFTGKPSLTLAHRLRRRADAILTGSGTVLADRATFTLRHVPDIPSKSRNLCILDRRGRVDAAYLEEARQRGFRPMVASDLRTSLQDLAAQGCNEVLVEAGPKLLESLRETGFWDEWVLIQQALPGQSDQITITNNTHPS